MEISKNLGKVHILEKMLKLKKKIKKVKVLEKKTMSIVSGFGL